MYPLSAILLLLNLTANFCKYNDHKINKINKTKIFKSLIHIEQIRKQFNEAAASKFEFG